MSSTKMFQKYFHQYQKYNIITIQKVIQEVIQERIGHRSLEALRTHVFQPIDTLGLDYIL